MKRYGTPWFIWLLWIISLVIVFTRTGHCQSLPNAPAPHTKTFMALEAGSFASAALDADSTQRNLSCGAVEANPLLGPHPSTARLWGEEFAITGATALLAWELWHRGHHRVAYFITGYTITLHSTAAGLNFKDSCQ